MADPAISPEEDSTIADPQRPAASDRPITAKHLDMALSAYVAEMIRRLPSFDGLSVEDALRSIAREAALLEAIIGEGLPQAKPPPSPLAGSMQARSGEPRTVYHGAPQTILMASGGIRMVAASGNGNGLRRFALDAYNGGPMQFDWSLLPVVVDIAGIDLGDKPRPVLLQHDHDRRVGHTVAIRATATALQADGVVSGGNDAAREVVESADRGFPWQCSIGVAMHEHEEIREGQSLSINGRTLSGPLLVIRSSELKEISFVTLGADDSTAGHMAAGIASAGCA